MVLTNEDKIELARWVKRLKELGYCKTKAIEKLHWTFGWKKRTINIYWKIFNEKEKAREK